MGERENLSGDTRKMSSTPERPAITAAVLTVSDSVSTGSRKDLSGPAVVSALQTQGYTVVTSEVVPDERTHIENALARLCNHARLVVTTGGTGIARRDVTPEATRSVCDRVIEGLAEHMRAGGG